MGTPVQQENHQNSEPGLPQPSLGRCQLGGDRTSLGSKPLCPEWQPDGVLPSHVLTTLQYSGKSQTERGLFRRDSLTSPGKADGSRRRGCSSHAVRQSHQPAGSQVQGQSPPTAFARPLHPASSPSASPRSARGLQAHGHKSTALPAPNSMSTSPPRSPPSTASGPR